MSPEAKLALAIFFCAALIGGAVMIRDDSITGAAVAANRDHTNFPPKYVGESRRISVEQNTPLLLNLNDLFVDPEGDELTFLFTQTENVQVDLENDDQLTITPEPGFTGERILTIFASDGNKVSRKRLKLEIGALTPTAVPVLQPTLEPTPEAQPEQAPEPTPTSEPEPAGPEIVEVEAEVEQAFSSQTEVSVIIVLKEPEAFRALKKVRKELLHKERKEHLRERKQRVKQTRDAFKAARAAAITGAATGTGLKIIREYDTVNAIAVKLTRQELELLKNNPNVAQVLYDRQFSTALTDSVPQINADDVWNVTANSTNVTGKGETICVIDTGIDINHSAFIGKLVGGHDFVNEDTDPQDDATNSHGTHVSGIAAGNSSNVMGVAPDAPIVPVKICNQDGSCTGSDVLAGIDYCNNNSATFNITAISGSIGDGTEKNSTTCPTLFDNALSTSVSLGIIPVFSSGNDFFTNGINYPACSPYTISVGSVSKSDVMDSFSNSGGDRLDVLAPGNSIVSSTRNNGTGSLSGTSMATPHVSGIIALVQQNQKAQNKSPLSLAEMRQLLIETGLQVDAYHRIDAWAAVVLLNQNYTINLTDNSVSNMTPPMAKVKFKNDTDFSRFPGCAKLKANFVDIDSVSCPEFNKSAHIVFEGLPGSSATPLRNGQTCPSSICVNVTFSSGTLEFDVTEWTNYSSESNFSTYAVPTIDRVDLNSTNLLTNDTAQNLTAFIIGATDSDGDPVRNITDWRVNDVSIAVINMPFETNESGTDSGRIRDYSTNTANGTLGSGTSAPTWNDTDTVLGGAYGFDAVNDFMTVPSPRPTLPFTLEFWVKPNTNTPVGIFDSASGQSNVIRNFAAGEFEWHSSNPQVTLGLTAGQWYHLVFVYEFDTNRRLSYYRNGTFVIKANGTTSSTFAWTTPRLGDINTGSAGRYNGLISEFRIYNRSLSSEQIIQLYLEGNTSNIHPITIVSNETRNSENWSVAVTPNDNQNSTDGDGATVFSNNVSIQEVALPLNVTIEKTEFPEPAIAGKTLSYFISLNVTGENASNISMTDIYPDQIIFQSATPSPIPGTNNTFVIGNRTPKTVFQVNITVLVNNGTNGILMNNTANITFQNLTGSVFTLNDTKSTQIVGEPTIDQVILNTTNLLTNDSAQNLTLFVINATDDNGDAVQNITDWRVNETSIALLNFPFETNDSSGSLGAIRDYSTFSQNLTLNGTDDPVSPPFWTPHGQVGGAIILTGEINDSIVRCDATNFPTDEFTLEFWINTTQTNDGTVLSYAVSADNEEFFLLDPLSFQIQINSQPTGATGVSVNDGRFHHVAVTWRSLDGRVLIYKDGVIEFTGTESSGTSMTNGGAVVIGQEQDAFCGGFASAQALDGTIDELRVYNRTLSNEQIQAHFLAGVTNNSDRNTVIVKNETRIGDIWSAAVTPNDNQTEGATVLSNNVTILQQGFCITINESTVIANSDSNAGTCITVGADNIEIDCDGHTLTYGTGGGNSAFGILAEGRTGITIKNCNLTDASAAGTFGIGINFTSVNDSKIIKSFVSTNGTNNNYGILLSDANRNVIANNTIQTGTGGSDNTGIRLTTASSNNISLNIIKTNGTSSNSGFLINSSSADNVIADNRINTSGSSSSNFGIEALSGPNNYTSNSIIANGSSGSQGISFNSAGTSVIRNNNISTIGASSPAVLINASAGSSVIGNILETNNSGSSHGIDIVTSSNVRMENNTIRIVGTGSNNFGIRVQSSSSNGFFVGNNISTNGTSNNHGIIVQTGSNDNIFLLNNISTNGTSFAIVVDRANGTLFNKTVLKNPAEWINTSADTLTNFTNLTFSQPDGDVEIISLTQANGSNEVTKAKLSITENNVFLNSSNLSFLNTTAILTFPNIFLVDPKPTVDFEDDGSFADCPFSICTEISFANNVFKYNVTQFTSYSVGENMTCPNSSGIFTVFDGQTFQLNRSINCSTVTVKSNGTLILNNADVNAMNESLNITAENLSVLFDGLINGTGTGFVGGGADTDGSGPGGGEGFVGSGAGGGGAGHGGFGGNQTRGATADVGGGIAYGSSLDPDTVGSGGGGGASGGDGGDGGGAIVIDATRVFINGSITVRGEDGVDASDGGGGGSGGTINIQTSVFEGIGTLVADGGKGGFDSVIDDGGGGGAGGHIIVRYNNATFPFTNARVTGGGPGSSQAILGESGTLGFLDLDDDVLYIQEGWRWQREDRPDWNFTTINITNALTRVNDTIVNFSVTTLILINGSIERDTNIHNLTINITAVNLSIDISSRINVSEAGFYGGGTDTDGQGPGGGTGAIASNTGGGGAGHGGFGGNQTQTFIGGGKPYGSPLNPDTLGSGGGGGGSNGIGGDGGGTVFISANNLTVNGNILADGGNASNGASDGGGGGAGGSINIITDILDGTGNISAIGGDGGFDVTAGDGGGGGAGGHIMIRYNTTTFNFSNVFVTPGRNTTGGAEDGQPGTLGFLDVDDDVLYIQEGWRWELNDKAVWDFTVINLTNAFTRVNGSSVHFSVGTLILTNSTIDADKRTDSGTRIGNLTFNITATNLTVNSDAMLNVSGAGFAGGNVDTDGQGPGGGTGAITSSTGGGGAGHGGFGGNQTLTVIGGGKPYGSSLNPDTFGSGGGGAGSNGVGGDGAGRIFISTNITTNNGNIIANGINGTTGGSDGGGGGAGGTINLITNLLEGTGNFTAIGGDGGFDVTAGDGGGGGAGGHIMIRYNSTTFPFSNVFVTPGRNTTGGAEDGQPGTLGFLDTDDDVFTIQEGWRWKLNDKAVWDFTVINITNAFTRVNDSIVHFSVGTLILTNSTIDADSLSTNLTINITATNLTVNSDAMLNVSGAGFAGGNVDTDGAGPGGGEGRNTGATTGGGGAGHGGFGGNQTGPAPDNAGGFPYGSPLDPFTLGSGGGGADINGVGGDGGGIIIINVQRLVVNGTINANGVEGTTGISDGGGGGAGGSINIFTDIFEGNGSILAQGGDGGRNPTADEGGGGGAGGHIMIRYKNATFPFAKVLVTRGENGSIPVLGAQPGEPGTLGFLDLDDDLFTIQESWRWERNDRLIWNFTTINLTHARTRVNDSTIVFNLSNLILTNSSLGRDRTAPNLTINISTTNLTIDPDSRINVSGAGFRGGGIDTNGTGPGGGEGRNTAAVTGGGGAGHGGFGGSQTGPVPDNAGGISYGSSLNPNTLGSGGGGADTNGIGGTGGGIIIINSQRLVVNGTINANGIEGTTGINDGGGGGSGGTINIFTTFLEGNGNITAQGGDGGRNPTADEGGGGGAGGRILIRFSTITFNFSNAFVTGGENGSIAVAGAQPGEPGTLGFLDVNTNSLTLQEGWSWNTVDEPINLVNVTTNFTQIRSDGAVVTITDKFLAENVSWRARENNTILNATRLVIQNSTINAMGERLTFVYGTEFNDFNTTYQNGSVISLENRSVSRVAWSAFFDDVQNLSTRTRQGQNVVFVNSSQQGLNVSANITLFNIMFTEPKAVVDFEDDGSFVDCAGTQCSNLSFANNVFVFNVTSFTTYSSQENGTAPNNAPIIQRVDLNSTNPFTNDTNQNLTAFIIGAADADGDAVQNITDFRVNDNSIARLNLPFETNVSNLSAEAIRDYSTFANNATLGNGSSTGAPVWNKNSSALIGGAYVFDGTNDFIETPPMNIGGLYTVTVWINLAGTATFQHIVSNDFVSSNYGALYFGNSNNIEYWQNNVERAASSAGSAPQNQWTYVTLTYDGSVNRIYVNGTLEATSASHAETFNNPVRIGSALVIAAGDDNYTGRIDEVRIYNRTLSSAQINQSFQDGLAGMHPITIVSQETAVGENWSVAVTPNDNQTDGATVFSNNVTIQEVPAVVNNVPTIDRVDLNSTDLTTNDTNQNLTAFIIGATDADGEAVQNITDFRVNNISIAVLNMPFENHSNASAQVLDFSTFSNNGTVNGTTTFNISSGRDGRGAYQFDSTSDFIEVGTDSTLNIVGDMAAFVWVNITTLQAGTFDNVFISKGASSETPATNYPYFFNLINNGSLHVFWETGSGADITVHVAGAPTDTNTWHQFGFVRDNTTSTVQFYVDGVLLGTGSFTNAPSGGESSTLYLGRDPVTTTLDCLCLLDDVMIFNRSLSSEQVSEIFQAQVQNISQHMTVIVSNETNVGDVWSVAVTPHDGIENGTTVFSNNVTIQEAPNVAPTIDRVDLNSSDLTTNDTNQNLTAFIIGATDADGDPVKNSTDWRVNGPSIAVLNMPFEAGSSNSTNTTDFSTFGNDGNVNGSTFNSTDGFDDFGAYQFDGTNDQIVISNSSGDFAFGTGGFAITSWINTTASATGCWRAIVSVGGGHLTSDSITVYAPGTGSVPTGSVAVILDGVNPTMNSDTLVNDGNWHFVTLTKNASTASLYIDGVLEDTASTSINVPSLRVYIGTTPDCGTFFGGNIDEVRIYNRSLFPEQILALFNNRTDLIVSNETKIGENWSVAVTPNDKETDGATVFSNNVTIQAEAAAPEVQFNFTNLTITKTDTPDPVENGTQLNYTINVTVNGIANGTAFNITVNETYPDQVIFDSAQPSPAVGNTTFILGNLSNGTSVLINITVNVTQVTNGTLINNTVNTTFQNETGDTLRIDTVESTTVEEIPGQAVLNFTNLSVTKVDAPDPVENGTQLNYTIFINVTGNGTAFDVRVNETYPPQVVFNNATPAPEAGTNNTFFLGNLTPGTNTTINITVNVTQVTNGTLINNTINTTFQNETGGTLRIDTIENTTIENVTITVPIQFNFTNLTITKTDTPDPVENGTQLNYTINVTVNGIANGTAFNITVNETYPDQVIFDSAQPSPAVGNTTFILGNLSNGTSVLINITVNVTQVTNGTVINNTVNTTFQNETGDTLRIDTVESTTVEEIPGQAVLNFTNLTITKTDNPDPVENGTQLNYTINVTVNGIANGTAFNVLVNETYPDQVIFDSALPAPVAGTNNTFDLGNLSNGTSVLINITVNVTQVTNGTVINNTLNTTFQNETGGTLRIDTVESTTVEEIPGQAVLNFTNLSVTKVDAPDPVENGTQLNYTIFINVTGNGTAFDVRVNETYPPQVVFNNATPAPEAGTNNTFFLGNLTPGTNTTINITINVTQVTNGTLINNTLNTTFQNETGGTLRIDTVENTTIKNITITVPIQFNFTNLTINKTDTPDPVENGTQLNYTINVTVNGIANGTAFNVTVNETYPAEVVFDSAAPPPVSGTNNTFILGNLSNGTSVLINITVNVTQVTNGTVINNTVNTTFQNETGVTIRIDTVENTTVENITITEVAAAANITSCPVIVNRTSFVNNSLLINGSCITVNNSNLALNCTGLALLGNGTGTGIKVSAGLTNITIINCNVTNFSTGMFADPTDLLIENNTYENNTIGLNIFNTTFSRIRNNTFNNNTIALLINQSQDNNFSNNTFLVNNISIWMQDSLNNTLNDTNIPALFIIEDTTNGIINFTDQVNITQVTLPAVMNITNNNIFVNSSQAPFFNVSAELTFRNIGFIDPQPIVDFEDDGTFADCPASICTNISFANNIFVYNVTQFTAYSSEEGFVLFNFTNLTINKSDTPDPVENGTQLNYTINVTVNGLANGTAFNVTVNETYPPEVIFDSAQPSPAVGNTTFILGNLSNGTSVLINITVNVTQVTNGTVINNTLNTTFQNETGGTLRIDTVENTTVEEIPGQAVINFTNLTITKTDNPDPVENGTQLNYTINVTVNGIANGTAFNVLVNETYPTQVVFDSAQPDPVAGTNNTFDLRNLTNGTSILINITVNVTQVTNGTVINNTLNTTFQNETGDTLRIDTIESTTIEEIPGQAVINFTNLTINKSDTPDPIENGTQLNYTINVTVNGLANGTAFNVLVNETYPDQVIFDSAAPSPEPGTNNTFLLGNLSNGTSVLINITVNVTQVTNGTVINNTVNTTFQNETGGTLRIDTIESTIIEEIPGQAVINFTNLTINKSDTPDPVENGTQLNYTINVTVNGIANGTAFNVLVNETYPTQVVFDSAQPDPVAGTNNTFDLGNLTNGTSILINITVNVTQVTNGTVINNTLNTTFQNETGDTLRIDTIENTTIEEIPGQAVINITNLTINKSDTQDPVDAGSQLNYTINVTVNGIANGTAFNVLVNETYPPQVIFDNAVPSPEPGTNNTFLLGNLSNGTSVLINITVNVSGSAGSIVINNTVNTTFQNETGDTLRIDTVENTTVVAPVLFNFTNLTITKTDNPDPIENGTQLNYTINVTVNSGANGTAFNITVNETYPPQVIFDSAQPSPAVGNTTFILGNLSNGTSVLINITVNVTQVTNGTVINNTVNTTFQNETGGTLQVDIVEGTTVENVTVSPGCSVINGSTILSQSITSNDTCITFGNSNIELDCDGFTIFYDSEGVGGDGIVAENVSNITVKDCIIIDINASGSGGVGINITRGNGSQFINNSITTNGSSNNYGIHLFLDSNDNSIENNTVRTIGTSGNNHAIFLLNTTTQNNITSNTIFTNGSNNNRGIVLDTVADNNTIVGNNITTSGRDNNDGIRLEDSANNNNVTANTIRANGSTDNNRGIRLFLTADNNTIFNNNITTSGDDNNDGIELNTANGNNVTGNRINATGTSNNNRGIDVSFADDNTFDSNFINTSGTNNNWGVHLSSSNSNNVTGNTIRPTGTTNNNRGVFIESSSTGNRISGNDISTSGLTDSNFGIRLESSSDNNNITGNVINTTLGTNSNRGISLDTVDGSSIVGNNISTGGSECCNYGIIIDDDSVSNNITGNVISTKGSTDNYGIYLTASISETSSDNNIRFNTIQTNGTEDNHGIRLQVIFSGQVLDNTFDSNNISTAGSSSFGIHMTDANRTTFNRTILNDTVEWVHATGSIVNNFTDTTFITGNGSIRIPGLFVVNGTQNATKAKLNITFNNAFLNSTNLTFMNTTGRITLNNITFPNPRPLVDFEDDGTFAICPASICTEDSFTNNVFVYNVTQFTTYSSGNTPLINFTNLTVSKSDSPDPVENGTQLNYTITITVNGLANGTAFNVTVNETYPAEVIFNSAEPSPSAGTNNTFILGNLSNGTTIVMNITVNVTQVANNTVINNTINVTFQNETGGTLRIDVVENTTVENVTAEEPAPAPPAPGGGKILPSPGGVRRPRPEPEPEPCVENWACEEWSRCTDDLQTRICVDINHCNATTYLPITQKACLVPGKAPEPPPVVERPAESLIIPDFMPGLQPGREVVEEKPLIYIPSLNIPSLDICSVLPLAVLGALIVLAILILISFVIKKPQRKTLRWIIYTVFIIVLALFIAQYIICGTFLPLYYLIFVFLIVLNTVLSIAQSGDKRVVPSEPERTPIVQREPVSQESVLPPARLPVRVEPPVVLPQVPKKAPVKPVKKPIPVKPKPVARPVIRAPVRVPVRPPVVVKPMPAVRRVPEAELKKLMATLDRLDRTLTPKKQKKGVRRR